MRKGFDPTALELPSFWGPRRRRPLPLRRPGLLTTARLRITHRGPELVHVCGSYVFREAPGARRNARSCCMDRKQAVLRKMIAVLDPAVAGPARHAISARPQVALFGLQQKGSSLSTMKLHNFLPCYGTGCCEHASELVRSVSCPLVISAGLIGASFRCLAQASKVEQDVNALAFAALKLSAFYRGFG